MKFTTQLTAGLFSLGLLVAATAEDAVKFNVPGVTPGTPAAKPAAKPAAPAVAAPVAPAAPAKKYTEAKPAAPAVAAPVAPAAPAKKYTEAQVAEAYGWFVGDRMGLRQLEFTPTQVEAMARGMVGLVSGAQPTFDPKEIGPEVEAFLARKNQAFMGKLLAQQTAMAKEYFAKLKENKNVVALPSGLNYEILKAGTGAVAKPGQLVTFHYTGSLVTGQVFDSSVERGQPAELLLLAASPQSPTGFIAGMFEGMQKTGIGGKLRLHIPAALAYGDEGNQAIPPGAALIFEVEILGAKDAPKEPAAK